MWHMETKDQTQGLLVHQTLAYGYSVYIVAIVGSFIAQRIYPHSFVFPGMEYTGLAFIVLGTLLVFWAQNASYRSAPVRQNAEKTEREQFHVGPYKFSRSPTQYGLFLMVFGLGILEGMTFLVITAVISLLLGRFIFIRKEEKHLALKYGDPYREYKKKVRF